jgi:Tfp pilus assembly protein PilF
MPENPWAHLNLARIEGQRGNWQRMKLHLDQAARDQRTSKEAHLLAAQMQQRLGDEASAQKEHELAAKQPSYTHWPDFYLAELEGLKTGLQNLLVRANRLAGEKRLVEATALLQQIVKEYPESEAAWLLLGKVLARQQDLPASEHAFRIAVRLAPGSAEPHFNLGANLLLQKKYQAAVTALRKAIDIKPDCAQAHYRLAQCFLALEDEPGALENLRLTLRYKPDSFEAHVDLGELLAKQGRNAEALVHLLSATKVYRADARVQGLLQRVQGGVAKPKDP